MYMYNTHPDEGSEISVFSGLEERLSAFQDFLDRVDGVVGGHSHSLGFFSLSQVTTTTLVALMDKMNEADGGSDGGGGEEEEGDSF